MTNENKTIEEQDPDLDALLDDALDDFNKTTPSGVSFDAAVPPQSSGGASAAGQQVLTEEMIRQATQNFEASMRAIMMQQQYAQQQAPPTFGGAGPAALPTDAAHFDVNALTAEFAKFAESASKVAGAAGSGAAAVAGSTPAAGNDAPDFKNMMAETVKQMMQNTQDFQSTPSADELSQLLSGLGLAGGEGGEGEAAGLFPLMQSMLENILSKDILYPPIKEIVDKYPDWLADNRTSVEPADFDRYSRQFDIMKKVVELFESENESDSDEVKAKRFEDLMIHMQKLQEEGHPPAELGGDVAGNLASLGLDASGGGAPDFSSLLAGLATAPAGPPSQEGGGEEQCCLM